MEQLPVIIESLRLKDNFNEQKKTVKSAVDLIMQEIGNKPLKTSNEWKSVLKGISNVFVEKTDISDDSEVINAVDETRLKAFNLIETAWIYYAQKKVQMLEIEKDLQKPLAKSIVDFNLLTEGIDIEKRFITLGQLINKVPNLKSWEKCLKILQNECDCQNNIISVMEKTYEISLTPSNKTDKVIDLLNSLPSNIRYYVLTLMKTAFKGKNLNRLVRFLNKTQATFA